MAITLTIRGSNTDSSASGTDVSCFCAGVTPKRKRIGEPGVRVGGTLVNPTGWRTRYAVEPFDYTVTGATGATDQDQGDLDNLIDVLMGFDYLWVYSVTGSSRVGQSSSDYWGEQLAAGPVAVVLAGDPLAAEDFGSGSMKYSFELEHREVTLS